MKASIWMAVLTLTAIVMGSILLSSNARPAQAAMVNAQPNVTMMTTGTNGGDEGLIIVDRASQKMIVYIVKGNDIVPIATTNLAR